MLLKLPQHTHSLWMHGNIIGGREFLRLTWEAILQVNYLSFENENI